MINPLSTQRFSGIIPPMVTPMVGHDQIDITGLDRLIEHILSGGVHGLFILGTTGEGPSLSYALRRELIERTCQQVDGRVPVIVGVTDTSYTETVALAEYAKNCGADAVVLAPPYYFPAGQPELLRYFRNIVAAIPLPVMLYNMPACTKICIEHSTLRQMLEHPNVVGFKDSSGDATYFHRAKRLFSEHPEKTILVGPEELLAELTLLGGDGGVSGGANIFPRLYVDLFNAARENDVSTVQHLHSIVIRVTDLYRIGQHASATIKGIKCALGCMGICNDYMAEPFSRFHGDDRDRVRRLLSDIVPIVSDCGVEV